VTHALFARRLAGTAVVDAEGRPRVVYHGTTAAFDRYRVGDEGIFFAESPETASTYAEGEGGNIRPAWLAIRRPLVMTWREWLMGVTDAGLNHYLEGTDGLARRGYDGVILTDPDPDDPAASSVTFIAVRAEQILGVFEHPAPAPVPERRAHAPAAEEPTP
jgi:hypothetical protein